MDEVVAWCSSEGLTVDRWNSLHYTTNTAVIEMPFPTLLHHAPLLLDTIYAILRKATAFEKLTFWLRRLVSGMKGSMKSG
jgi:hypothetical protein